MRRSVVALSLMLGLLACESKRTENTSAQPAVKPQATDVVDAIVEVESTTPANESQPEGIQNTITVNFKGAVALSENAKDLITISGGAHALELVKLVGDKQLFIQVSPSLAAHRRYVVKLAREVVATKGGKLTMAKAYEFTFNTSREAVAPNGDVVREVFVKGEEANTCDAACAAAGSTCQTACYYNEVAGTACYFEEDGCWYNEDVKTCGDKPAAIDPYYEEYPLAWQKCCCLGQESNRLPGKAGTSCEATCDGQKQACVETTAWAEGQAGGIADFKQANGGVRAATFKCTEVAPAAADGETLLAVTCGCR